MSDEKCPICGGPLGTGDHSGQPCIHCQPEPVTMISAQELLDLHRQLDTANSDLAHVRRCNERSMRERDAANERAEGEKARRVYYQDIVYAVCNMLDKAVGVTRVGAGVVCGTVDAPSDGVQRVLAQQLEAKEKVEAACVAMREVVGRIDIRTEATGDNWDAQRLNIQQWCRELLQGGNPDQPLLDELAQLRATYTKMRQALMLQGVNPVEQLNDYGECVGYDYFCLYCNHRLPDDCSGRCLKETDPHETTCPLYIQP